MIRFYFFLIFILLVGQSIAQQKPLLLKGHSHNDYLQNEPLTEALRHGFTSIEIDVYSHKNQIKVSHFKWNLAKKKTLEELYLLPLQSIIEQNGGTVYPNDSTQVELMIDLKKDKAQLYPLLRTQFKKYESLLQTYSNNETNWGPLKLVLSGNPPVDSVLADQHRYFYIDAPLSLTQTYDTTITARASANFISIFGTKKLSPQQWLTLKKLVEHAQQQGIKTRFWNTPDTIEIWKRLVEVGVDWINVDALQKFKEFSR